MTSIYKTFRVLNPMLGSWLYPQTLDLAVNACQGQTFLNYGRKKFYDIVH
jgi:hypothetical protein